MKALIFQGKVVQLEQEEFPVSEEMQWVDVGDDVKVNDLYNGKTFTSPPDITTFADKRESEYPPLGDQIDAIMKGFAKIKDTGVELPEELTGIIEARQAVKDKYPKDEADNA